jgi:serine/threonine protein phosphatase PrpC
MGGHDAGEVASSMVVEALRSLPEAADLNALQAAAVQSLRDVNQELIVLARSNGRDPKATIGTTVVGLAIADSAYLCFWMGDSRAYRLRGGTIARVSHDHSLVQELVDAGMLSEQEAETHANANLITRAVGANEVAEVATVTGDAQSGDVFLLASDGLTRLVPDEEIAAELSAYGLEQAADNLIEKVLERGAPDNVSLVITRVA